jgi:hypothetical protein
LMGFHMSKLYHIFVVFKAYIIYNETIFMEAPPWDTHSPLKSCISIASKAH